MLGLILTTACAGAWSVPAQAPSAPFPSDRSGISLKSVAPHSGPAVEEAASPPRPDVVLFWNEVLLQAVRADRTPPPLAARNLAVMHAAVFDAVNAVEGGYRPFRAAPAARAGTSPEVAAAVTAHRVLTALYPKQVERFDAALDDCCTHFPDGPAKENGVAFGQLVAEKYLDWRAADGTDRRVSYSPRHGPGLWQPTPPGYEAALLPQWPRVLCFAMARGDQFRPGPAPALTSAAYAASFNEVKALGARDSRTRTADQTEIAWFWADGDGTVTPPGHWNRIAQAVARERKATPSENARLFALLNLALADAGIAAWDCKFAYDVWRPVHAIREADSALNPDTRPDPSWTPLLNTPPFPSYISGHSTFSGAAAAALAAFFGTDEVRFTSTSESLPGVRRSFTRFSDAAAEAGKSRIYGGIHYEFDNAEGLTCGREIGRYVARNFLQPR